MSMETISIDQLFIDDHILPRARKKESGEMVTSRKELMDKLRIHGVKISLSISKKIFEILEQEKEVRYSPENNSTTTILITPKGIEHFIYLINTTIQDTWDNEQIFIDTPHRVYKKRDGGSLGNDSGNSRQLRFQW